MKIHDDNTLPNIKTIISYFLTSHITSFKFYGDKDGILYHIENKIFENIELKLRANKEGLYEMATAMSAITEEIKLLSIYRYFDIGDSRIDDDFNGVIALYVLDYKDKKHEDNKYAECWARCDVFSLTELKANQYNKPSSIIFNKEKSYDYLFGNMCYLVEKMLYAGANTIEFHPIDTVQNGGFDTEIKILDENKNIIEIIKSDGSSVFTLYDGIEYRIRNKDGVKVVEEKNSKKYLFPHPSYSEDGLHLVLTEESWTNYKKWDSELELSYSEIVECPTKDVFCIHLEYI